MDGGDACGKGESSITYDLTCNYLVEGEPEFHLDDSDLCNPVISFEHKAACSKADIDNIFAYF